MFNLSNIEILLYIPDTLSSYKKELELFIKDTARDLSSTIEIDFTEQYSNKTQIVLSLVSEKLGELDAAMYQKYQNKDFRFLSYYFQDIELTIDELNDEIFRRIEFQNDIKSDINLYNNFTIIDDLKNSIETNVKEFLSDLVNKTNYSKINSSVLNRSKGFKFYDNDSNLHKVDSYLRREKRVSLINGMGGVGKTTLAIEYASQSLKEKIYDYVIWLDVENGIDKEIQKFTIEYLLSNSDDGKQGEVYYKKKFSDFVIEHTNSLVILDNYEDQTEELNNFINDYKSLNTIITSRRIVSFLEIHPIELNVFQNADDALKMFLLNSIREYSFEEKIILTKIISLLGNLPLALEITANFLSDSPEMNVEDYFKALQDKGLKLFDKLDEYKPKYHLESLRATLSINKEITKDNDTLKILKIFAIISPDPISREIIENYLMNVLQISNFDKVIILKTLERFSYIKKSEDGFSMHRLLQEAIRLEYFNDVNMSNQIELISKMSLAIFHWFVERLNDNKYGSYFEGIKKHSEYIIETWKDLDIGEAKVYLHTFLSAYYENIGDSKESIIENVEIAMSLLDSFEISNDDKAIVYTQYGKGLVVNRNYTKALKIYDDAMNIKISNNDIKANVLANRAGAYTYKNMYQNAEKGYHESIKLMLGNGGENSAAISRYYNNLANVYEKLGKREQAEELYIKSLNVKSNILDSNHPGVGTTYYNLGILYMNNKKYQLSFKNLIFALKLRLNIEMSPRNIYEIEQSVNSINDLKPYLMRLQKTQKVNINKQIDELNSFFEGKKMKYKIKKLK